TRFSRDWSSDVCSSDLLRSCQFYLQQPDPFGHFIELVKAIEKLIATGHPAYPVDRTLLTTGILDALMTSHHEGGKRIETPHLKRSEERRVGKEGMDEEG